MAKKVVPGSITAPYLNRQGDFSPNLVGFQFTEGSTFMTFGNFALTTNLATLTGRIFNTGDFSEEFTLDSLNISQFDSELLNELSGDNLNVKLKYDKSNFFNYVYFSDAETFVEKEIEGIIVNWLGSLYVESSGFIPSVLNTFYNVNTNTTTFSVNLNNVTNTFSINTETFVGVPQSFPLDDDIRTLHFQFKNYVLETDTGVYNLIGYSGNTPQSTLITLTTDGDPWSGATGNINQTFHIRPNDTTFNKLFFSKLSDFQEQLLNRRTSPKYTLKLRTPVQTPLGFTFDSVEELTWPTSDGFNIDVSGRDYGEYLEKLFLISKNFDLTKTDLINRRMVSKSILEFDTSGDGTESNGRKINKLIKIWGREYDHIKKYIDGISFANVVTYNGEDNTPDELIKLMASSMGFDTIQSFADNDLIKYLIETNKSVFNNETNGLTIKELDTELWRRLIINAWWLFKSKGTRKVIEFFLKLFNINENLIDFNEYVYVVDNKLSKQKTIAQLNNLLGFGVIQEETLPIDDDGFPKILPNTPEYYFQMDGFWYNGGETDGVLPNLKGNNPHFGPYDFGRKYFDVFRCFIPNFDPIQQPITLNELTINYFTDYSMGTIEGVGTPTTIINNQSITQTNSGNILNQYNGFYGDTMSTNGRITKGNTVVRAGRVNNKSNGGDNSFRITIQTGSPNECDILCPNNLGFNLLDGTVTFTQNNVTQTLTNPKCCTNSGFYNYSNNTTENPNIDFIPNQTKCFWCPPPEFIHPVPTIQPGGTIINVIYYKTPNNETKLIKSESCCTLRGFQWDGNKKLCTKQIPLTPIDVGDTVS